MPLSPASRTFNNLLSFASRNERKLGAGLFALGFLTDLLTFTLLPLSTINLFFAAYLILTAVCAFGANVIYKWSTKDVWWRKSLAVLFPLGVQYALGGLLSGFVVFYASHSVVSVSWPFLLLLALVYIGNEYYRKQREHLIFQTVLFFFALYAYAIFALPLFAGSLGPWIFLGSTLIALVLFAAFLWLLYVVNEERTKENLRPIGGIVVGITLAITGAYFTGVIPPLPLALAHGSAYHSVVKTGEGYLVEAEEAQPWWDLRPQTIHLAPGAPLYAFTAVVAPASFGGSVVHRWEHKNSDGDWITLGRISFPISGGREEGYRGYSVKEDLAPGAWRVSVETPGGQVIGRFGFTMVTAAGVPALHRESL